jgi:pilus assembly protein CpaB
MPAKTVLATLFLVSLAVLAVLALKFLPQRVDAGLAPARPAVLAAALPLKAGTLLRGEDVAWRPLKDEWEPGVIMRPDPAARRAEPRLDEKTRAQVYGGALRVAVAAGDPIRVNEVVKPGDRDFLRVVLVPGERAISIPVATGGASTGLLTPGDRVDVILTQHFGTHQPLPRSSVSETIVQDLRVLAIDARNVQTPGFGRTVTLEVTPEQAEKIDTATVLGKLSLTLRPSSSPVASGRTTVGATWAGDVSPALGSASSPKPVTASPLTIDVIRGTHTEAVKR